MPDATRVESDTQLGFTHVIDVWTQSRGQHDRQKGTEVHQRRGGGCGCDRDAARRFRIHRRHLHEALQCNRERAHSWTRFRRGNSLFEKIDLLASTVADASASVDIDEDIRVSLPSIGLRGMLRVQSDGRTLDSQLKPPRGAEGISSFFGVHRTPKLARLDVPQSCRAVGVEDHEQIMFLAATIMDT